MGCFGRQWLLYLYVHPQGQRFFFEGDTTIGSHTYGVLKYYLIERDGPPWLADFLVDTSRVYTYGFVRDDSTAQRSYTIRPQYGNIESILFDNTLIVGDTAVFDNIGYPLLVTQINLVTLLDSLVRRQWELDYGMSFTEGVGGSEGFFHPLFMGLGWWYTAHCYSNNQVHLYGATCFEYLEASAVPDASAVRIYPNPARHQVHIERPSNAPLPFVLYNALGQVVANYILQDQQTTLSLEHLPSGLYYYQIGRTHTGSLMLAP